MDTNIIFNSGANYDFIVALKLNDKGLLEEFNYPIIHYQELKQELLDMLRHNVFDVLDMNREYSHNISTHKSYDKCMGHNYSESYISPIISPGFDETQNEKLIEEQERLILAPHKKQLKKEHPDWSELEIESEARLLAERKITEFHYKQKFKFIIKRARYIEAAAYELAYNEIKDSVFFISTEYHGWTKDKHTSIPSWEYKINQDLTVSLWSNFCYGNSSRFLIQVYYKGIKLCPYSELITYRFANKSDILNYTRDYILDRSSWEHAAKFVLTFCNGAIKDPDGFVKKEILYEINTLVQELKKIATSKQLYLDEAFCGQGMSTDRYSGVKYVGGFDEIELKKYNENPKEYELLFRTEKISSALSFLKSIEQFSSISDSVSQAILDIKKLNINIYPELTSIISELVIEVSNLKADFDQHQKAIDELTEKLEYHFAKINRINDRSKTAEAAHKNVANYRIKNPELSELESKRNKVYEDYYKVKAVYEGRNKFLCKLSAFKKDIDDSGIL